jgi:hypothetical protein
MRILLTALTLALALLIVACSGDDSSTGTPTSSETPTFNPLASGQATVNAQACTPQDVTGTFVSTDGAAGHVFLKLKVGSATRECTLPGPPEVRWHDTTGAAIPVSFGLNTACTADNTDYATCVFGDAINLSSAGSSPSASGAVSSISAVVAVTEIGVLPTCTSAKYKAHSVGLQFPDTPLDVQIALPSDIDFQTCAAQAILQGYGPASSD